MPRGWRAKQIDGAMVLAPPSDSMLATVRYVERRRPVRTLDDLIRADGVPQTFVANTTSAPRWLRTTEGELAVLVTVAGELDGVNAELSYGYVLLDDFYASVTGIAVTDPAAVRATITQLLTSDVHVLGWRRRRRYAFTAPAGFRAAGDGFLDTRWRRGDESVWVSPAMPIQPGIVGATLEKLGGSNACERISTRHGLVGEHHHLRGDSHVFFLLDEEFMYSVRVDGDQAVGRSLIQTIEPIARPRPPVTNVMQFWAE